MHPLTTSDLAFLLCTTSSGARSPARAPLVLRTTYGLEVVLRTDGSLSVALSARKTMSYKRSVGGIDAILSCPTTHPRINPPQNRHYLLSPDFTTSTYLWSPNSESLDEWVPADEALLDGLYSGGLEEEEEEGGSWFEGYLDWVGRAEDQLHQMNPQNHACGLRESNDSFISVDSPTVSNEDTHGEVFKDEGERTLWMVEGMLLASWLALQDGVEGVGYRPVGGENDEDSDKGVYLLERVGEVSLGEVVRGFLRDVRA
ncbi:hypothetical protein QBC41DRAFT_397617 [Cercophora samala]|uniref:Uncharacterized protein n=1 Tax=Cercophora samala TaxID=330535 RepID=A0AA40D8B2_9PEZI|nr:hypothetical protein QBC41DRAFT_397617 [Cercophora samala]